MSLLISAIVQLLLGIIDRIIPSIAASIRAKQAGAKLAADEKKIDDAINKSEPTK